MTDPFFIIGNPRSGTSVLRLMLCSHPRLFIPPECGFIIWWREKYGDWSISDTLNEARRENFGRDLLESRKFDTWKLTFEEVMEAIISRQPASYAQLCETIYMAWGEKHFTSTEKWGDKNNFHVRYIPELSNMFPDSRFIHIIRDLRGVAASYLKLANKKISDRYAPDLPTAPEDIADDWSNNIRAVREGFNELEVDRRIEIRYEDLVSDPRSTLSNICDLLDVHYHEDMMEFHSLNAKLGLEPRSFSAWKGKTWQKLDPTVATKWESELSPEYIDILESKGRQLLVQYGYL